jgi:hypothetical protein
MTRSTKEIGEWLILNNDRLNALKSKAQTCKAYDTLVDVYKKEYKNARVERKIYVLDSMITFDYLPKTNAIPNDICTSEGLLKTYMQYLVYAHEFIHEFVPDYVPEYETSASVKPKQKKSIPVWLYLIAAVLFALAVITIIAGIVWILIGIIAYMKLPKSKNIFTRVLLGPFNFM